jgi:hypothetical protein
MRATWQEQEPLKALKRVIFESCYRPAVTSAQKPSLLLHYPDKSQQSASPEILSKSSREPEQPFAQLMVQMS